MKKPSIQINTQFWEKNLEEIKKGTINIIWLFTIPPIIMTITGIIKGNITEIIIGTFYTTLSIIIQISYNKHKEGQHEKRHNRKNK